MNKILIPAIFAVAAALLFISAKHKPFPFETFDRKALEKSMALIPADSIQVGTGIYDTIKSKGYHVNERMREEHIPAFYISKYEVRNLDYLYYLYDLQQQGRQEEHTKALPDTLVWRDKLAYNEPYTEYYFRHPAYHEYPLVGVTYEQAKAYCDWLSARYNKEPKRKYKNVRFRLPSKNEWIVAARGGRRNTVFPWVTPGMLNEKGRPMANFYYVPQENIVIERNPWKIDLEDHYAYQYADPEKHDNADITAPVNAYSPNAYGLHNMSGNVEEYVQEKGITKGGSWSDSGYYLKINTEKKYETLNATSSQRGFRILMELLN